MYKIIMQHFVSVQNLQSPTIIDIKYQTWKYKFRRVQK